MADEAGEMQQFASQRQRYRGVQHRVISSGSPPPAHQHESQCGSVCHSLIFKLFTATNSLNLFGRTSTTIMQCLLYARTSVSTQLWSQAGGGNAQHYSPFYKIPDMRIKKTTTNFRHKNRGGGPPRKHAVRVHLHILETKWIMMHSQMSHALYCSSAVIKLAINTLYRGDLIWHPATPRAFARYHARWLSDLNSILTVHSC